MVYLEKQQEYVIYKFLQRYDYDAVLDVLEEAGIINEDICFILDSCKYAVNFDFDKSIKSLEKLSNPMLGKGEIQGIITNLNHLKEGEADAILSELIENIRIQIINEEYIDFLGRLYRLKEALFKFIFVNTKQNKTYKVCMNGYMVSKKNILYTLKKKYNIYTSNLIKGVTIYVNRHVKNTKRMETVLSILNGERLENLIRLRNESPAGHGFKGVSKEEIEDIYGEPMEVTKDLVKVCELLDLEIKMGKYDEINDIIIQLIGSYTKCNKKEI